MGLAPQAAECRSILLRSSLGLQEELLMGNIILTSFVQAELHNFVKEHCFYTWKIDVSRLLAI